MDVPLFLDHSFFDGKGDTGTHLSDKDYERLGRDFGSIRVLSYSLFAILAAVYVKNS